jgi:hypothetical protein
MSESGLQNNRKREPAIRPLAITDFSRFDARVRASKRTLWHRTRGNGVNTSRKFRRRGDRLRLTRSSLTATNSLLISAAFRTPQ